jgi:hypothetical protein
MNPQARNQDDDANQTDREHYQGPDVDAVNYHPSSIVGKNPWSKRVSQKIPAYRLRGEPFRKVRDSVQIDGFVHHQAEPLLLKQSVVLSSNDE